MPRGKNKGGSFEREMCKKLSLWWTKGERDDVFWRSASSGGMATIRSRKGSSTFGQHGDVQATDPMGQPLIDLVAIELKRGYSSATLHDLLDKKRRNCIWDKHLEQAKRSAQDSSSLTWLIIAKRDRRESIVVLPAILWKGLSGGKKPKRPYGYIGGEGTYEDLVVLRLDNFFENVSAQDVIRYGKRKAR